MDICKLNNNLVPEINVDFKYEFSKDELSSTDMLSCECSVKGKIYKNSLDEISLDIDLSGVMRLCCAITLKPVDYNYHSHIEGTLEELTENEENFTNTLDIFPIIWENILLEIPMRVVSPEASDVKLSGDGWKLVTDEEVTSSPFAELEDLLDE